jgi:hypothetical protein
MSLTAILTEQQLQTSLVSPSFDLIPRPLVWNTQVVVR